jgi:hypothetical protein
MRGEEDYGSGAEDAHLEQASQDQSPYGDIPNLTQEEMQALQPKKTKVVNPWIHGQTHHEYLDKIIVSENFFLARPVCCVALNICCR